MELGLLELELGLFLLERRPNALQLGSLRFGLLSLLLRRGPLNVALAGGPRKLLLQHVPARSQTGQLGVGVDIPEHQIGVVVPKPAHLGVQPGQLGALFCTKCLSATARERRLRC